MGAGAALDIAWDQAPKARWDRRIAAARGALQQDWAYGAAVERLGGAVARAEISAEGRVIACAQMMRRRFGGALSVGLLSRGPVWLEDVDAATRAEALRLIKRSAPLPRPRAFFITPDETSAAIPSAARLTRVMTGHTEAVIALGRDETAMRHAMKGKWRNRLRAAETAELKVTRSEAPLTADHWLLAAEADQRGQKGYDGPPAALPAAFQAAAGRRDATLLLEARAPGSAAPLAGMLFLRHGAAAAGRKGAGARSGGATYLVGWSGAEGRRLGAHNLLLWRAMQTLAAAGTAHIDLGGLDTRRAAGLARFKLGAGARPRALCGTFV